MRVLAGLGIRFRRGMGRVTPEPFVLAVFLTAFTMLASVVFSWSGPPQENSIVPLLSDWSGSGMWRLLAFAMQACLMLVLGTAVAEAPIIKRGITRMVAFAPSPRSLVGATAGVSMLLALLNWSLALIGGALFAREAGRLAKQRGWKLHYPLLCAAAYSGLMVWHGGLSGTAPLKVTGFSDLKEVLGHDLAKRVGELSLETTLFSPLNLFVSGGLLLMGMVFFAAVTPGENQDPSALEFSEEIEADSGPAASGVPDESPDENREEQAGLENSRWVLWLLVFPMAFGWWHYMAKRGIGHLDLNGVNLALWVAALCLHPNLRMFLGACQRGVQGCTGIMLQFPLYAGIMALMASSGLSAWLSQAASQAGAELLPVVTFLSAGLINLFVPSGGGQWAVQGPVIMEAALLSGLPPQKVVMAMAYGDQWTNMLQPFWALPLLAITGVKAKDIVGYTLLWMIVGGAFVVAGLLLF